MEVDAQQGKNNTSKGLVVLLCVLGVVIVGLVIGMVIIMNIRNGGSDNEDDETIVDGVVMMTNAPTDMDIMSTYGEGLLTQKTAESFDLAMQYFDEKSREAVDDDAYFSAESIRVYLLLENDYLHEAITFLDKVQESRLNNLQLYTIYNYYRSAYEGVGDETKTNEYQEKMDSMEVNSRFEI